MATSKQLAGPALRRRASGCEGGGTLQLRREFRVKRHEKLTGPRFDVASKFRCTSDRSSPRPCRLLSKSIASKNRGARWKRAPRPKSDRAETIARRF